MFKNFFRTIIIFLITILARLVLWKYHPKIVGVTGNTGKTSVKDAVAAVLETKFSVWKNEKSYNSDLGIPLTILHCQNAWLNPFAWMRNILDGLLLFILPHKYPEWLVLEVGADKPDDIGKFASWLQPDIVVVTRIGEMPVHVEFFSSRQALIDEKSKLVTGIKRAGFLVLNADDPDVAGMRNLPKLAKKVPSKIITYGFSEGATLRASNYSIIYTGKNVPSGINFKVDYSGNIMPVRIPDVVGRQNVYSALAALSVGVSLDINFISMIEALARYDRPPGRLRLIKGVNESMILDDTYNASPAAVELAIESTGDIENSGRKIAVLGDMLELGAHTMDAHRAIGQKVAGLFNFLITVGPRSEGTVAGATDAGMPRKDILSFSDSRLAGDYLKDNLNAGDLVLVKGSQGMRMERVVEKIMAEPKNKSKLLVRQEEEWLKK